MNVIGIENRYHKYTHKGYMLKFSEEYCHESGEFHYIFQYMAKFYIYTICKFHITDKYLSPIFYKSILDSKIQIRRTYKMTHIRK